MTGIAGAAYYLKKKMNEKLNTREREMFETLEKAITYSNKIIDDLLEYSREIRLELSEAEPKSLLKEAFSLIEVPQKIHVLNRTGKEPRVKVDKEKMRRVFVNIVKNAFDAMPDGGKLTVKSGKERDNVTFTFSDTGAGMSERGEEQDMVAAFHHKSEGHGFRTANLQTHSGSPRRQILGGKCRGQRIHVQGDSSNRTGNSRQGPNSLGEHARTFAVRYKNIEKTLR